MKGARSSVEPELATGFRRASRMASATVAALGVAVLVGWALDIDALKSVHGSLVSMKANTALGFLLIGGAALLDLEPGRERWRQLTARSLAAAAAALGVVTLVQYLGQIDLGIDELLVPDDPEAVATAHPGRMSPLSALNFLVLGAALLLLDVGPARRRARPAEWLALLVGLSSLLALIGYAYEVDALVEPRPDAHTAIALHTALGFFLASAAVLFARPDSGAMRLVSSATPGGVLVRSMLPAAILLPVLLGWLRVQAERNGLFGPETGLALFAAVTVVCFGGLVLWSACAVQRAESARHSAERAVRAREEDLAITLDSIGDAVIASDEDGRVVRMNSVAEKLTGWAAADAAGRGLSEVFRVVSAATREEADGPIENVLRQGHAAHLDDDRLLIARDGSERAIADSGAPIRDAEGNVRGAVLVFRDQTARRAADMSLRESEARKAAMLEASLDCIVTMDHTGAIVEFNQAAERTFGYSRADAIGKQLGELLVPPAMRDRHARGLERYLAGGQPTILGKRVELSAMRSDGSEFPAEVTVVRIRSEGDPMFTGYIRDLTERKLAETAIRDLQRERAADVVFRALLEAAPDAMVILEKSGCIALVNSEAERMFGYAREEMLGKPIDLLFSGGGFEPHSRAGASQIMRGRRKEGSEFPIEVSSSPIETDRGPLLSTAIRDIAQRVEDEERLRRAKDAAEIAMAELESFSYSVAHDLRSPLRSINGFSSAILEDWADRLDEQARDYLRRIVGGAERMGHLIDALLTLARVSRTELRRESVDLTQLATAICGNLRAQQPERSVEFVLHPNLEVRGDPQLLRVLLENLLDNAWKFSSRRARARIEFGCARDDGDVYYVNDDGAGFDMRFANKLFIPFQRLHASSEFPGTGIGLATVQRIVRRHGGRIWGESVVDRGATFYFTLAGPSGT
jgi:PAS domain S-box-containing protein